MTNKCLLFILSQTSVDVVTSLIILNDVKKFCKKYNVVYKTQTTKINIKIWFNKEEYYTLFMLLFPTNKVSISPILVDEE